MGALVQDFKLLVAHAVHELGMRQQQGEQPLGQRRHGAPALIAAHVALASSAPLALAFALARLPVALPAALPVAFFAALPAALAPAAPVLAGRLAELGPRRRTIDIAGIQRLVVEIRRRPVEMRIVIDRTRGGLRRGLTGAG